MRVLIIDPNGNALDLAMRALRDGHQVKWFLRPKEANAMLGVGFVDIIYELDLWWNWPDIIINADNTHYLATLDKMRERGLPVISCTKETGDWELDRDTGMEVLRQHDIATPPSQSFSNYDEAINYVKKEDCRFVSKASGDANKALSYVAKNPSDLVFMLERWKSLGTHKGEFILQEFIEGTEMAVGAWVGANGFTDFWCENFEFKKLMNGDMGQATGEQGTVLRYTKKSKLAQQVLAPLEDTLVQAGYTGYIDVNCIIDESGHPWPLEFTTRFGWPTTNIQQELHTGDFIGWLHDLTTGARNREITLDTVAIGVVLSIPDYPYSHLTKKEVTGIPVYGITDGLWPHVHPCEMMLGEAPCPTSQGIKTLPTPVTAGDYVLVMSATGETVLDARDRVYRRLKRLIVPNSPMYRTDIGNRLRKQLPLIQAQGYATGMAFSMPATS